MDKDRAYLRALCQAGTRRPRPGDRAAAQNTHHNDMALYAIDADPATGIAYRVAQVHGTVVRYLHALDVTALVAKLAGNGTDASRGGVKFC